ncbi:MAG: orotate phosphoribosyltransferase [Bacteroidota bacterium]
MQAYATTVATHLLQINAIKLSPQNPFTWASGIQSPIYCDNRITLSYPEVRQVILEGFKALSESFEPFDAISGVATAGIPHAMLLAHELGLPFSYVRSKPKEHGRKNQIEGKIEAGQRILMIEDLISTGGSSLKAVEAVRESGAIVVGVLAIFTYGFQQAADAFEASNCPFATLSNYETLLQTAVAKDYISTADLTQLNAWNRDPSAWGK